MNFCDYHDCQQLQSSKLTQIWGTMGGKEHFIMKNNFIEVSFHEVMPYCAQIKECSSYHIQLLNSHRILENCSFLLL